MDLAEEALRREGAVEEALREEGAVEEALREEGVFGTLSEGVNVVGRGGVVRVRGPCRVGERLSFWGLGDDLELDGNDDEMHIPSG